ncbi:DNA gyrase subunit B [Klebsiella oxytoca]|jgi:hypothetical protein|nr:MULTISPECIES: hypothetical protein [Klebsiella]DAL52184.1 MAG TPA_asm: hypothetical protein [Caudoviricetes sp.]AKL08890.1 DNA gyrase subunit B [Klebsiella oxytoca]AKL25827.1 DNA gyrase subunit B [Klebsiella oxytoca]APB44672.1 DNA gyrase subunit B [Klebsiella oxytoca]EKU7498993.1 DNA gyrase subunit B [Klebsiella oxytoca]
MVTQKLIETYMLVNEHKRLSRVKYEIFSGTDNTIYALITVYAYEPVFHIKGYDSLTLNESVDTRAQVEEHFAAYYS